MVNVSNNKSILPVNKSLNNTSPLKNQRDVQEKESPFVGEYTDYVQGFTVNISEKYREKQEFEANCQTCAQRTYVDGSSDPGVSMKTPTNVSPEQAASVVAAHEQEHVSREKSKAEFLGQDIVFQAVQLYTSICPECGKAYVSGGKTTTQTQSKPQAADAEEPALDMAV